MAITVLDCGVGVSGTDSVNKINEIITELNDREFDAWTEVNTLFDTGWAGSVFYRKNKYRVEFKGSLTYSGGSPYAAGGTIRAGLLAAGYRPSSKKHLQLGVFQDPIAVSSSPNVFVLDVDINGDIIANSFFDDTSVNFTQISFDGVWFDL